MAKNSDRPIGMPSRMRFKAPTDGLLWFDSIREMVELVTPALFANSRWERPCLARRCRSRLPMSILMGSIPQVFRVFDISQTLRRISFVYKYLVEPRKGLVAYMGP